MNRKKLFSALIGLLVILQVIANASSPLSKNVYSWKMSKAWLDKYEQDENIIKLEFEAKVKNWWKKVETF